MSSILKGIQKEGEVVKGPWAPENKKAKQVADAFKSSNMMPNLDKVADTNYAHTFLSGLIIKFMLRNPELLSAKTPNKTKDLAREVVKILLKDKVDESKCPKCGGEIVHESQLNEKKDACYYKVKSRYKVWPSAYASGALVKCRKSHGKWGSKKKTNESSFESDHLWKISYTDGNDPTVKTAYTKTNFDEFPKEYEANWEKSYPNRKIVKVEYAGEQTPRYPSDYEYNKFTGRYERPTGIFKENEKQVNEISKETVKRYIPKNIEDQLLSATGASYSSGKKGDPYNKAGETHKDKMRQRGIERALKKLSTTNEAANSDQITKLKAAQQKALYAAKAIKQQEYELMSILAEINDIAKSVGVDLDYHLTDVKDAVRGLENTFYTAAHEPFQDMIDYLESGDSSSLHESKEMVDGIRNAIINRILHAHDDLLAKYGPVKVGQAVDDIAAEYGGNDLQEIGSSDVTAFTKAVVDRLARGEYNHLSEGPSIFSSSDAGEAQRKIKVRPAGLSESDDFKKIVVDISKDGTVFLNQENLSSNGEAWKEFNIKQTGIVRNANQIRALLKKLPKFKMNDTVANKYGLYDPVVSFTPKDLAKLSEAPGPETLAHNEKTEKQNLKAFGLAEDELDENCWKGYHKEGNKKMFGKTVPNCVKNESSILKGLKK